VERPASCYWTSGLVTTTHFEPATFEQLGRKGTGFDPTECAAISINRDRAFATTGTRNKWRALTFVRMIGPVGVSYHLCQVEHFPVD